MSLADVYAILLYYLRPSRRRGVVPGEQERKRAEIRFRIEADDPPQGFRRQAALVAEDPLRHLVQRRCKALELALSKNRQCR